MATGKSKIREFEYIVLAVVVGGSVAFSACGY